VSTWWYIAKTSAFEGQNIEYPLRKLTQEDKDLIRTGSARPNTDTAKRALQVLLQIINAKARILVV
jgi:hypothetical protein